jgi:S-methylmethionine-dependent homocysteine/selenocysteine methylase
MDRAVCHNKVHTSRLKSFEAKQTGKDTHPHPETNNTWSMFKQQFFKTKGNYCGNCCKTGRALALAIRSQ